MRETEQLPRYPIEQVLYARPPPQMQMVEQSPFYPFLGRIRDPRGPIREFHGVLVFVRQQKAGRFGGRRAAGRTID